MSVIGDIIDAIITDIGTAIGGVTTEKENVSIAQLKSEDLPRVRVVGSLFESDPLDFLQETHRWTVELMLVQSGGTRETLETKIEAIRDQIFADPTLGAKVDRAYMQSSVPHSQPDAKRLIGRIVVIAEKVKS